MCANMCVWARVCVYDIKNVTLDINKGSLDGVEQALRPLSQQRSMQTANTIQQWMGSPLSRKRMYEKEQSV